MHSGLYTRGDGEDATLRIPFGPHTLFVKNIFSGTSKVVSRAS